MLPIKLCSRLSGSFTQFFFKCFLKFIDGWIIIDFISRSIHEISLRILYMVKVGISCWPSRNFKLNCTEEIQTLFFFINRVIVLLKYEVLALESFFHLHQCQPRQIYWYVVQHWNPHPWWQLEATCYLIFLPTLSNPLLYPAISTK